MIGNGTPALIHRRHLLAAAPALLAPAFLATRGWAMPAGSPRLLVLFLRGGYDSNSLLVPRGSDFYYRSRPSIAIPPERVLGLDAGWGLNNAVAALKPLWDSKALAFVPFAGSHDLSRSHFETQDIIEFGYAGRNRAGSSGFLNRLAGELGARGKAVAFTGSLPVVMRGPVQVPNINLSRPASVSERRRAALSAMYADDPDLGGQVSLGLSTNAEVSAALAREMTMSGRGAPEASAFEATARRIGVLMREQVALAFADVGGWDTHVNQAGGLDFKLGVLAGGLAALAEALGPVWRDTAVLVISEFGRSFRENGGRGTDHGHGTTFLVMGGAVAGARIAGAQVAIDEPNLHQNRDLPVLNEVRDVAGGLFGKLFGLTPAALERIFPGARPADLGLV